MTAGSSCCGLARRPRRTPAALVVDDSGDRKDGVKTAHMGRQWLGRYGKDRQRGGHGHHAVGR